MLSLRAARSSVPHLQERAVITLEDCCHDGMLRHCLVQVTDLDTSKHTAVWLMKCGHFCKKIVNDAQCCRCARLDQCSLETYYA